MPGAMRWSRDQAVCSEDFELLLAVLGTQVVFDDSLIRRFRQALELPLRQQRNGESTRNGGADRLLPALHQPVMEAELIVSGVIVAPAQVLARGQQSVDGDLVVTARLDIQFQCLEERLGGGPGLGPEPTAAQDKSPAKARRLRTARFARSRRPGPSLM
jgi:hypothetical protein